MIDIALCRRRRNDLWPDAETRQIDILPARIAYKIVQTIFCILGQVHQFLGSCKTDHIGCTARQSMELE